MLDKRQLPSITEQQQQQGSSQNHSYSHHNQNPYNDIAALQKLGNDTNVVKCIEALEDDHYVYIITPYIEGGELHSIIPWNISVEEHTLLPDNNIAKRLFVKILESIEYIQLYGVCHRDIKGENILIDNVNDASTNNTLLIDMEMSLIVPISYDTGRCHLVRSTGACGTWPFVSPEISQSHDFDGFSVDIWSLGVILFNLITGERLYDKPRQEDHSYQHFILEDGLVNHELNNKWLNNDKLKSLIISNPQFQWITSLLIKIQKVQNLSEDIRNLLHNMLKVNYKERYTTEQIRSHSWII